MCRESRRVRRRSGVQLTLAPVRDAAKGCLSP
jgi:hypothetical protein